LYSHLSKAWLLFLTNDFASSFTKKSWVTEHLTALQDQTIALNLDSTPTLRMVFLSQSVPLPVYLQASSLPLFHVLSCRYSSPLVSTGDRALQTPNCTRMLKSHAENGAAFACNPCTPSYTL
jgi:hypothetical protein